MIGAITAGVFSVGAPPVAVVTGGTLYTSGGYNYRVFTGNGTLTVSGAAITADILIIAGGGGGGFAIGGGGGAGGLLGFFSQSFTPYSSSNNKGAVGGCEHP